MVRQAGLKRGAELEGGTKLTYNLDNKKADVYAENIRMKDGSYEFNVNVKSKFIENIRLK